MSSPARPATGATTAPMFGREADRAALLAALGDPAVRLVTLTGRGGVGKTRLAMEIARERIAAAPGQTTVVPLDGVGSADLVMPEIAAALGVPPASVDDADEVVAARLGGDDHLLVLDNVEHVLDVAPRVSALIERCAGLQVLATSQAPLQLRSEHVIRVAPLPLPVHDPAGRFDTRQPAVATYLAAARAADTRFEIHDAEVDALIEMCRRLEGLPLALELAGARAATLRPGEIVRCLDQVGIDVLARSRSDAPARHHDLAAAIAWTYDLLAPGEQHLLGTLASGSGTFTVDVVLAAADVPPGEALTQLGSLVDLHLVDGHIADGHLGSNRRTGGPTTYRIPSSVREHAAAQEAAAGRAAISRRRYVEGWAALARVAADEIESGASGVALAVDRDGDGLLSALRLALDDGLTDHALDVLRVLAERWDTHGYHRVHEALVERCLADAEQLGADTVRLARAWVWSALLGLRHTSTRSRDELDERLRRAEAVGEQTGDDHTVLFVCTARMLALPVTRDLEAAAQAAARALELSARPGNEHWRQSMLVWAGMVAFEEGDVDRAVTLGRAALDDARSTGDDGALVRTTLLLGPLTLVRPELLADVPSNEEALAVARLAGQPFYEAVLEVRLAHQAAAAGDPRAALRWAEESLLMARAMIGSPFVGFQLLAASGALAIAGDELTATRLHGVLRPVLPLLDAYDLPAVQARREAQLAAIRESLGEEVFEAEAARGSGTPWPEAVEIALDAVRESAARLDAPPEPVGDPASAGIDLLTARQREVLRLLAAGRSNKDIAAELGISAKTVMHHTTAIYRELGVRGRSEATAWAYRSGFLDGDAVPGRPAAIDVRGSTPRR